MVEIDPHGLWKEVMRTMASLLVRVALLCGVLALSGGAQGCGLGDKCFYGLSIRTTESSWTQEGEAFCRARGLNLHTIRGFSWTIEEICCYRGGIF